MVFSLTLDTLPQRLGLTTRLPRLLIAAEIPWFEKRGHVYHCKDLGELDMLKEQSSTIYPDDFSEWDESETLDIHAIIQESNGLPPDVTNANIKSINKRVLNQRLLSLLVSQVAPQDSDSEWQVRQQNRKKALSLYLGRALICVFIQLPGLHYTIEVDPKSERVVHWEWQKT